MDLLFLWSPRIEWRHITRNNGLFRGDGNLTGGSFMRQLGGNLACGGFMSSLFMFRMSLVLQSNPETYFAVISLWNGAVSCGRTQPNLDKAPGATSSDPMVARSCTRRVDHGVAPRIPTKPISRPLPDIPMHIVKAPGIWGIPAYFTGLFIVLKKIVTSFPFPKVVRIRLVDAVPPRIGRSRSRTTGIFPLGFGR